MPAQTTSKIVASDAGSAGLEISIRPRHDHDRLHTRASAAPAPPDEYSSAYGNEVGRPALIVRPTVIDVVELPFRAGQNPV